MPPAERRASRNFRYLARSPEEEEAYNYRVEREKIPTIKFTSFLGSVAHIVKGALGGGILSGHVAYLKGGVAASIPLNVFFGVYMGYCLYLLVISAQMLYKRTKIPVMSYADVGEAACLLSQSEKVRSLAKPFRYTIDALISLDLFGSCCCYQIIIAKQIKQLVEDSQLTTLEGKPGYPDLRVYLALFIPLIIAICMIRHLKYLAPFSMVANLVILLAICMAVYYASENNPKFQHLTYTTSLYGVFEYVGMIVFSMSCAGVVIPIENNMEEPERYPAALAIGMALIIVCLFLVSFFGYAAFLDKSESPITLNFPMTMMPKILKGSIAVMIYVTHALNFWVPFNLCFYYLKRRHNPEKIVCVELCYRAVFVTLIGLTAIVFPDINAIMGFIGCFCLSNMAFIWPNIICLLVVWDKPGLGQGRWRLWRGVVLIGIGVFIFFCGSMVNAIELISVFIKINVDE